MPHFDHGWRNVNNWIPTCVHEFHGNLFFNTGPKPSQNIELRAISQTTKCLDPGEKRLNTMTGLADEDVIPDVNNSERHLHAN